MSTNIISKMVINANGKDIVLNGLDFTKDGYVEILQAKSVIIKNCRVYKLNCENEAKNYWLTIKGDIPVQLVVTDTFFGPNRGTAGKLFNLIELNAKLTDKSMISRNWFDKECCTHNAINVYGAYEGASLYINDNHFETSIGTIRFGIKGSPKCFINMNRNTAKAANKSEPVPDWPNFMLFQPFNTKTSTFKNVKLTVNDCKFGYENVDQIVAYFGASDTPISRESSPTVVMNGQKITVPIKTSVKKVAVVDTTSYATLEDAISAAEGRQITLLNNTNEEIDISTLDLVAARDGLTVNGIEVEF